MIQRGACSLRRRCVDRTKRKIRQKRAFLTLRAFEKRYAKCAVSELGDMEGMLAAGKGLQRRRGLICGRGRAGRGRGPAGRDWRWLEYARGQ